MDQPREVLRSTCRGGCGRSVLLKPICVQVLSVPKGYCRRCGKRVRHAAMKKAGKDGQE